MAAGSNQKRRSDDRTPANVKKQLDDWFGSFLRTPPPLDFDQLRGALLDPQDRSYQGWADGPTADMLRQARRPAIRN